MGKSRRGKDNTVARKRKRGTPSVRRHSRKKAPAPTRSRYVFTAEKSGAKPELDVVIIDDHTPIFEFWEPDWPPHKSVLGPVKEPGRRGAPRKKSLDQKADQVRTLRNQYTPQGKHKYSWPRIARKMGAPVSSVRQWYKRPSSSPPTA